MRRVSPALFIVPLLLAASASSKTAGVQWINRAEALESRKNWQGLQALADRWIKAQPHSAIAWFALSVADDELGQYAQAIDADRQALQINPQYAKAWDNLGFAYDDTGQYAQAIAAYRSGGEET